jgi:ATP-dependent DNA ligase
MVRNSRSAEGGISFAVSGRVESSASLRALEVPTLILDGEVAIFDQKLISRFEWLRRRAPARSTFAGT